MDQNHSNQSDFFKLIHENQGKVAFNLTCPFEKKLNRQVDIIVINLDLE